MRQPTTDNRQPLRLAFKLGGLALMSAVLITACRKEEPSPTLPGATSDAAQVNPTPRIKAFIERALAGDAKSGGTLSVDSAVWYVEAALNYTHARAWIEHLDRNLDTLVLSVPSSGGMVEASAAFSAFTNAGQVLGAITNGEQHLHMVDVVPKMANGSLEFLVLSFIGTGYGKGAPNTNYDEEDDYNWFWFAEHSICPCADNEEETSYCANKIIEQRINAANHYTLQPGEYWYSIETWSITTDPTNTGEENYFWYDEAMHDPSNDEDGYRDTRLFSWWYDASEGGTCVEDPEMSFWTGNATTGTWSAIVYLKSEHCPTKLFMSCNIVGTGDVIEVDETERSYVTHMGTFTFGLKGAEG